MRLWAPDLAHLSRDDIAAELARAEALGPEVENRDELVANAREQLDFADRYEAQLAAARAADRP